MPHGRHQIIPGVGAHTQHYATPECIRALINAGLIQYEPEYGPDARVFRPTRTYWDADTNTIERWTQAWQQVSHIQNQNLQALAIRTIIRLPIVP